MTSDDDAAGKPAERADPYQLTLEQLRGFQFGVAVVIMPVTEGWRVHYFSIPDFDDEPGTTFPTYGAAMQAVDDVLPVVNSREQRERATHELRERLRHEADPPSGA